MPIVHATSRVCKFHTCPIILFPSLSSSSLPSLPFFCAFSLFTHAPPPSLTHTSHRTAWAAESSAVLLRTCNRHQRDQQGERWRPRSVLSPRFPTYKQVSLQPLQALLWLDAWGAVSKLFGQRKRRDKKKKRKKKRVGILLQCIFFLFGIVLLNMALLNCLYRLILKCCSFLLFPPFLCLSLYPPITPTFSHKKKKKQTPPSLKCFACFSPSRSGPLTWAEQASKKLNKVFKGDRGGFCLITPKMDHRTPSPQENKEAVGWQRLQLPFLLLKQGEKWHNGCGAQVTSLRHRYPWN